MRAKNNQNFALYEYLAHTAAFMQNVDYNGSRMY